MQMSPDKAADRTAELAAHVAARYGARMAPGVTVTVVPMGATARPLPVWDGRNLVYPDLAGQSGANWRGKRHKAIGPGSAKGAHLRAAGSATRDGVIRLHAEGLTDVQIADALQVAVHTVGLHRRACDPALPANRGLTAGARRLLDLRDLISAGHDDETCAAQLNITVKTVRDLASVNKLALIRRKKPSRAAAARAVGPHAADAPPKPHLTAAEKAERHRARTRARYALKTGRHPDEPSAQALHAARVAERRAAVAAAHAEGLSLRQTAERLGWGTGSADLTKLAKDRRLLGLEPTPADLAYQLEHHRARAAAGRAERLARYATAHKDVVARHDAGDTVDAIAAALAMGHVRVSQILRRQGRTPAYAADRARAAKLADLAARAARGETAQMVADAWGWHKASVFSLASREGVSFTQGGRRKRGASPKVQARRAAVRQLRQDGVKLADMAAQLGVSMATICLDLAALDLTGTAPRAPRHRARARGV